MYHRNPAHSYRAASMNVAERLQLLAERQVTADERRRAAGEIVRLRAALREKDAELEAARQETETVRAKVASARAPSVDTEALQETRRKLHRLTADMANLRRRQGEERDRVSAEARSALLREFVEILDGFDRALAASPDPGSVWHQGSEALQRQMQALLVRAGVVALGAVGERFDPRLHEAVGTTDRSTQPSDTIAAVVQSGYRLEDGALIRPARVVVVR